MFFKSWILRLKKIYLAEQFKPTFLGVFLNPFYFARKGLYKYIKQFSAHLYGDILDIGCGQKPYAHFCNYKRYVGLELDTPENRKSKKADFFYDGVAIPFENSGFDCIMINQVFEHIFTPNEFLREVNRVTKIDGMLLLTVPFVWDEHEQPFDYARYSSFGIKYILVENGFEVIEHKKSNNGIEVIFQLLNAYIYKVTNTKYVAINLLSTLVLMAPINILGLVLSKILPKNDDLYLDNIILARKTQNFD
ncbi:hypothetical protein MASR1M90_00040 [Desulfovibrionales bacterium]